MDKIKIFRLKNGLVVISIIRSEISGIYCKFIVKSGWLLEPKNKPGLMHLLEHILLNSNEYFKSAENLIEYIEYKLEANFSLEINDYYTEFNLFKLPKENLELSIKLIRNLFFFPKFRDIEKEKKIIAIENKQRSKNIFNILELLERFSIFKENSKFYYTFKSQLYTEDLKTITKADIEKIWSKYFVPKNSVFLVLGNYDVKHLQEIIKKELGYLKNHTHSSKINWKIDKVDSANNLTIGYDKNLTGTHISILIPVNIRNTPSNIKTLVLLNEIIVNSRSSILFQKLRQQGLIYDISGKVKIFPNLVFLKFYTETDNTKIIDVIKIIIKEIRKLSKIIQNISVTQIDIIKKKLILDIETDFRSPVDSLEIYTKDFLFYKKIFRYEDYVNIIGNISKKDLISAFKNVKLEKLKVIILTNQELNVNQKIEIKKIIN